MTRARMVLRRSDVPVEDLAKSRPRREKRSLRVTSYFSGRCSSRRACNQGAGGLRPEPQPYLNSGLLCPTSMM
jgi:hypothetical protein